MFCIKCGFKNDDEALFCAQCGNKMSTPKQVQVEFLSDEPLTQASNNGFAGDHFFQSTDNFENTAANTIASTTVNEVENVANEVEAALANTVNETVSESVQEAAVPKEFDNTSVDFNPMDIVPEVNTTVEQTFTQPVEQTSVVPEEQQKNVTAYNQNTIQNVQPIEEKPVEINLANQNNSFNGANTFNANVVTEEQPKAKFSVKRFIFSALVIILALGSCAGFALDFIGLEEDEEAFSYKGYVLVKEFFQGGGIIDELADDTNTDDLDEYDIVDDVKVLEYTVVGLAGAVAAFTLLEVILLIFARKRSSYVLTMLFSLINIGGAGFLVYNWCFKILDQFKEIFEENVFFSFETKLTATVGYGLYIVLGCQVAILICSIVLMTCKNNKKVK